jgi:signal transduction histidine kinase
MDPQEVPAPTLAAVRLARAQRDAMVRRLRPVGLIAVGVALFLATRKQPGPGLHGDSLGVLLAMIGIAVGGLVALNMTRSARLLSLVPFGVLLVASAALIWLQPDGGAGGFGFFVAGVGILRLMPGRRGQVIAASGLAAACLVLVVAATAAHLHGKPSPATVLFAILPGIILAAAIFTRRMDLESYQMERLLIDLERAQDAEVRAVALAERQRLAREMHDVLAHSLSGLTLQLEGARLLAIEDRASARLTDTIERAHHLARSGLQEARKAIGMLRDEELPGPERLAGLAAEFERDSGVHCEFTVTGEPRDLDPQARLALYRAAQEALTNIRKYACAGRVEIRLGYEPGATRLIVEDFGDDRALLPAAASGARAAGFPGEASPGGDPAGAGGGPAGPGGANPAGAAGGGDPPGGGYGLTGMRERAELLGGRLTTAATATGFRVELWIPA